MKNIGKIENLSYSIKENEILRDISFSLFEKEFLGIAGPSGSGKSTLGKLLVGLGKPTNGKITIFGNEYNYDDISLIRGDISLVFQNPNNQIIGNKVIDDLAFSLENRGVKREEMKERIDVLARELGITELLDLNPSELSGGQKQIVAIAGILIFNPKIIIFDEITSMLDMSSKKLVYELLAKIRKDHTIILITHDAEELYYCDRVILLDCGSIVKECTPKELFLDEEVVRKYELYLPFYLEILKRVGVEKEGELAEWIK